MTNAEKYENELVEFCKMQKIPILNNEFCHNFIIPKILNPLGLQCEGSMSNCCDACIMLQMIWLNKEYQEPKEPEMDWSNVAVDTPILVSDDGATWYRRYFNGCENGTIYTWYDGRTSWSGHNVANERWRYAKLVESESV